MPDKPISPITYRCRSVFRLCLMNCKLTWFELNHGNSNVKLQLSLFRGYMIVQSTAMQFLVLHHFHFLGSLFLLEKNIIYKQLCVRVFTSLDLYFSFFCSR